MKAAILKNRTADYRDLAATNEELAGTVYENVYPPVDACSRGPNSVHWDLEDHTDEFNMEFVECKLITPTSRGPGSQAAHCNRWTPDYFIFTYPDKVNNQIKFFNTKTNRSATRYFATRDIVTFNKDLKVMNNGTIQDTNTQYLVDSEVTVI